MEEQSSEDDSIDLFLQKQIVDKTEDIPPTVADESQTSTSSNTSSDTDEDRSNDTKMVNGGESFDKSEITEAIENGGSSISNKSPTDESSKSGEFNCNYSSFESESPVRGMQKCYKLIIQMLQYLVKRRLILKKSQKANIRL